MTLRYTFAAFVISCATASLAFAQPEGPKGGGGGGGGGGRGGDGASGVSGGGGPGGGGGTAGSGGGGGGGGSSFGSGGGGGSSIDTGGGFDSWSSSRGSRSGSAGSRARNRDAGRAAEPAYARAVSRAARSGAANGGSRSRGDRAVLGQAVERQVPIDRTRRGDIFGNTRLDPYFGFGYGFPSRFLYLSCAYAYAMCWPYDDWGYAGYGYYGLNSLFYDPYWFQGSQAGGPVRVNPAAGLGSLRLKVKPNKGQVFIDGTFVGNVDEFDGAFQKLKLEQGTHRVEIRLFGYAPLVFDVEIRRGQQTVFEGQLRPRQ